VENWAAQNHLLVVPVEHKELLAPVVALLDNLVGYFVSKDPLVTHPSY
jgi:hypothetical protein